MLIVAVFVAGFVWLGLTASTFDARVRQRLLAFVVAVIVADLARFLIVK